MSCNRKSLALGLVILLLAGCATLTPAPTPDSPKTQAWKALMTDKQVYDTTLRSLALLDRQGKFPAAVKEKAIEIGNAYLAAHNLAVQVLLDNGTPSLETVHRALDAFLTVAAPYTVGG